MKHIYFFIIFPLLILFSSCQSKKVEQTDIHYINSIKSPKLNIKYSENLETLALLYNLSESGDFHFKNNPAPRAMLARELTNIFKQFKNHDAVQKLNFLLNNDFVDSYDILLSIYHTDLPNYKQYVDYPPIYYENDSLTPIQVQTIFDDFNKSVKQFYIDANLEYFFEEDQKDIYSKLLAEVEIVAPDDEYINLMEDYYGIQRNSYTIIVSAFSFNGIGRSKTVKTDNEINIFQFVSSNPEVESDTINLDKLNSFTMGYTSKDYFQEMAIHELGHSFFQEALRENKEIIEKINQLEYLFTDSLKENMMNQGYIDWRMCLEEHLVRIGEIKIAELMGNEYFVKHYTKECIENRGFIYLNQIQEILLEYDNNRNKFKNITDFIPVLLQKIKKEIPNNS
jgi:hypothetical protein